MSCASCLRGLLAWIHGDTAEPELSVPSVRTSARRGARDPSIESVKMMAPENGRPRRVWPNFFPVPMSRMMHPSSGRVQHENAFIECHECKLWVESPTFYVCMTCPGFFAEARRGYRICATCEARATHDPSHALAKYRPPLSEQ